MFLLVSNCTHFNFLTSQLIKDEDVLIVYSGQTATLDNVRMTKDNILILLPPKETTNLAGIVISVKDENSKEVKADNGEVVKIGPGRQAANGNIIKLPVKEGDKCRYRNFAGSELKLDGKDYIVIKGYDVQANW